ncbi:MAG: glycosyltransferase family 4 protein [Chloroflexi bacterium]|nr:glycosyltransferase family 4 protein [Chloroflexota bacterium]
MHIIIHTQYYPPEIGAPQTRLHELAVELARHNIRVTVLTAMPNYPRGRIYDGYNGWFCEETLNGIRVVRTAIYPSQSANFLPRLFSYISFVVTSTLFGIMKIEDADFLLTESPPLFLGVSGWILSRWKRASWIFNISDLWPLSVVELGLLDPQGWGHKMSSSLERSLYKKAWLVTGQSKTIIENIQERFPYLRVYHLPNGVNTNFFRPGDNHPEQSQFNIMYAGLHGMAQGLDLIIKVAQKLSSSDNIKFILIGDGPEKVKLVQAAQYLDLDNIVFYEPVKKEEVPSFLRSADVLIVPLRVQLTGAVPSKLYEAMSMGKPIILIAEGEAAKIVNDADCGIVVRPGDMEGLVSAILYLKSNPDVCRQMGTNGRLVAIRNHDRAHIAEQFTKYLLSESAR